MKRNNHASVLAGLLLLAALAIGAFALLTRDSTGAGSRPRSRPVLADRAAPPELPESASVLEAQAESAGAETLLVSRQVRALRDLSRDRRAEVGVDEFAVRWITGRVARPAGTPGDESLTVVALGAQLPDPLAERYGFGNRSWEEREVLARTPVAEDGSFRLALTPEPDSELLLDIDGRFLFLDEPVVLDALAEAGDSSGEVRGAARELVLEPELGGAVRGVLVLPPGASEAPGEMPGEVYVGGYGMHYSGAGMLRSVRLQGELAFELRALQPGMRYSIWANSDMHPGASLEAELLVGAGELVEVQVPLARGATVSGWIVDASGAPLAGAAITGDVGAAYRRGTDWGVTHSDEHGRFELRGLAPGPQQLAVRVEDHLDAASDELELEEGQVLEDVRIVMDPGLELAGSVRWPDGQPAVGARLTICPLDPSSNTAWRLLERARSAEGSARSAQDGSFRMAALEPGAYAIHAALERPGDAAHSTGDAEPRGSAWSARLDSLEVPAGELVLTLVEPLSLTGRVLDEVGAAVDSFTVTVQREGWPGWLDTPCVKIERPFSAAEGEFEFVGLDPGAWKLSVRADSHLALYDQALRVPSTEAVELVLTRSARVAGRVLDPNGLPVHGAQVRVAADYPAEFDGAHSGSTESDAEGRFSLMSVGPGPVTLEASSEKWAPALEQHLDLRPGEQRGDCVVDMTHGGSIAGLVYDDAGATQEDRMIVVQSSDGDARQTQSDASGRFLFEHLAPGVHQVIATPDPEAMMAAEASSAGPDDMGAFFDQVSMTIVSVVEGQLAEVVLGAPPRSPVVVHGRVLRAGVTVPGASLFAVAESGGFLEGMRADMSDEHGNYELKLDEPGEYTFVITSSQGLEAEVDFQVSVPEVERFAYDLELPAGSIAGRVRGIDGRAPADGMLWIRREDGTTDLSVLMGQGSIPMEADGSFAFEMLHAGSYAISVTSSGSALVSSHGIRVAAGECTSGVELALAEAGRIAGTVSDEFGVGVPGAAVLLRDAQGRPLFRLDATSDHAGRFAIEGVPAGEVLVSARTEEAVTSGSVSVSVLPGDEVAVELTALVGVELLIELEDREGHPTRASIRVEDAAGHEHSGCASRDEIERFASEGVLASERRVGPLAPGRYTVSASCADGRSAQRRLTLREGLDERRVRLKLDD